MTHTPYRYSAFPMQDYKILTLDKCEVSFVESLRGEVMAATWNLFWLSNPHIDVIPTLETEWWQEYCPNPDLLTAVVDDSRDELMFRIVQMHPRRFIAWFEAEEDYSIYKAYEALGHDRWVATVLDRAEDAAIRIESNEPKVITYGNVIYVPFGAERAA